MDPGQNTQDDVSKKKRDRYQKLQQQQQQAQVIAPPPVVQTPQQYQAPVTATLPAPITPTLQPAPTPVSTPAATVSSPRQTNTSSSTTKLDPQKLPNPTRGFGPSDVNTTEPEIPTYQTHTGELPPRPDSDFIIQDTYNCSPRFMRSSMYQVPTTAEILKTSAVPFGIVVSPFAEVQPGEMPVPVVDMTSIGGPIRCLRCRAYINPFVTFVNGGDKYLCPFCGLTGEVPVAYFSPLVGNQRQDFRERVELWRGSIDYVATPEYKTGRAPQPTTYLFVVETTVRALQCGMLESFTLALQRLLPSLFENSNSRIGLITYDSQICFYNVDPKLKKPQMMVMGDLNAPFIPVPLDQFLVSYPKAKANFDALFSSTTGLKTMFESSQSSSVCTGSVLKVACKALSTTPEGFGGGKILLFTTSLPNIGSGSLPKRDNAASPETEKENLLYKPQTDYYAKLAQLAAKHAISIDLFIGTATYVDINSLGPLVTCTGGQIYYYPNFTREIHQEQLYRELYRNLTRAHGNDTILRLRCSQGVTVKTQYGHYSELNETDLAVPHIAADSSLAFELDFDDTVQEDRGSFFQIAVLYTSPLGQRLIRVHTLRLSATASLLKLFKAVDLDSVISLLARKAVMDIPTQPLTKIRKSVVQRMVSMLASYRKNCAKNQREGQLILPDTLKLLPIYGLGLLKCPLLSPFRPGTLFHSLPDTRSYMVSLLHTTPLRDLSPWLYPLVFEVHNMGGHAFHGNQNPQTGFVPFPGQHRLTRESLSSNGLFLMDTLSHLYLWVGRDVDPAVLAQVLPEQYINADPNYLTVLPRIETDLSARIFNLLSSRRLQRTMSPEIYVVKQGSSLESRVVTHLIEDGSSTAKDPKDMNYVEFLCHVHRRIQSEV